MNLLDRIKRLVLTGRLRFTRKALDEMEADGLEEVDVASSIVEAPSVRSKRSTSEDARPGERIHIVEGRSLSGLRVYTKGVIRKDGTGAEVFYVLVSAKRSRRS